MAVNPWTDYLQAGERFAQEHSASRPLQSVTHFFDSRGHIIDVGFHYDQSEAAAPPAPAPLVPLPESSPRRLRLSKQAFLDRIGEAVEGLRPGLKIPDLAEKLGFPRRCTSFRKRVHKYIAEGELRQDPDGFVNAPN